MQAQVLPKELRVTAPPTMPQARSYLFKQQSTLNTYNDSTNVIQINLPRLQRSYLTKESYLRFLVNASWQPGNGLGGVGLRNLCLDQPGAYGLIDKIEVYDYLGSTLLESTSGHGQLMSLLMDLDASQDERKNHFNIMAGTTEGRINNSQYAPNGGSGTISLGAATGGTLGSITDGVNTYIAISYTVTLPGQYLPRVGDLLTTAGAAASNTVSGTPNYTTAPIIGVSVGGGAAGVTSVTMWVQNTSALILSAGTGWTTNATSLTLYPQQNYINAVGQANSTVLAPPISGDLFPTAGKATGVSTLVTKEFVLPLFSFLGSLSSKFSPLHNGYTIMITLNSAANAFGLTVPGSPVTAGNVANDQSLYWNVDGKYSISNVYFEAQVLELGPVAESMLLSSTQGQPLIVPTKAFRNYVGSVATGQTNYRLDLNLNVASLTNILFIQRVAQDLNNLHYRCLSNRVRNYLQSWYFQYGSSILPQTSGITCSDATNPLSGFGEAYAELMKARHSLLTDTFNTSINRTNFNWDASPTTQGNGNSSVAKLLDYWSQFESGRFACGLDLELVTGKSGELVCGMNTNGMNTSIFLTFQPSASTVNTRVDCWAEYDAFINVSPGLATTVSF